MNQPPRSGSRYRISGYMGSTYRYNNIFFNLLADHLFANIAIFDALLVALVLALSKSIGVAASMTNPIEQLFLDIFVHAFVNGTE